MADRQIRRTRARLERANLNQAVSNLNQGLNPYVKEFIPPPHLQFGNPSLATNPIPSGPVFAQNPSGHMSAAMTHGYNATPAPQQPLHPAMMLQHRQQPLRPAMMSQHYLQNQNFAAAPMFATMTQTDQYGMFYGNDQTYHGPGNPQLSGAMVPMNSQTPPFYMPRAHIPDPRMITVAPLHYIQENRTAQDILDCIVALRNTINNRADFPTELRHNILGMINTLSAAFSKREIQANLDTAKLIADAEYLRGNLQENHRLLNNALAERDRACIERDADNKKLLNRRSYERLKQLEENLSKLNQGLRDKIVAQDALLEQQQQRIGGYSTRHENSMSHGMNFDKFEYADADPISADAYNSALVAGLHKKQISSTLESKLLQGRSTDPEVYRAESTGPTSDLSKTEQDLLQYIDKYRKPRTTDSSKIPRQTNATPQQTTITASKLHDSPEFRRTGVFQSFVEVKSTSGASSSQNKVLVSISGTASGAIATSQSRISINEQLTTAIEHMWSLVETVVCSHFDKVNTQAKDKTIQSMPQNAKTWHRLLEVSNVGNGGTVDQLIRILRSESTRHKLVMRIVVQFITAEVWNIRMLCDFDESAMRNLERAIEVLRQDDISQVERAQVATAVSRVTTRITNEAYHTEYRKTKIHELTDTLWPYISPLLNESTVTPPTQTQHTILNTTMTHAYDLAIRMFECGWSFQFVYPLTGTKFLAHSQTCRDDAGCRAEELQKSGRRIRLAVTPCVIMRDDRGVAIRVKQLVSADVLLGE